MFYALHSYLLAPQTSVLVGLGSPSSRVILIGSRNPLNCNLNVDKDPIIFSEIAEFAMSLSTPQKGQEAFGGFLHLQPYKLIRAASLAELGHIQAAHRYSLVISCFLIRLIGYQVLRGHSSISQQRLCQREPYIHRTTSRALGSSGRSTSLG